MSVTLVDVSWVHVVLLWRKTLISSTTQSLIVRFLPISVLAHESVGRTPVGTVWELPYPFWSVRSKLSRPTGDDFFPVGVCANNLKKGFHTACEIAGIA